MDPKQTLLKNALKTVIGNADFKGDGFKYNNAFISHAQANKEHDDRMAALDEREQALNAKEQALNAREQALDDNNITGLEEATKRFNDKLEQITVEYEVKLGLANHSKNACEEERARLSNELNSLNTELNSLKQKTAEFQKNLLAENIKALIVADEIKKNAINANNDDLQDKLMSANVELLTYKNMLKRH